MDIVIRLGSDAGHPHVMAHFVRECLKGIVLQNRAQLRAGEVPHLYNSGVRFKPEADGVETFADALTTYQTGYGDCAHLAAWRVADLQEMGEPASLRIEYGPGRNPNVYLFHVVVRRGNGLIEDPSRLLGMR